MIAVEGVSYWFTDGVEALRDVSFTLKEGEKSVLLGANGSGKTTLLKVLNGLLEPGCGSYRYRERPVTGKTLKDKAFLHTFRREVVLLFQNPDTMIFNPTVYDEIAFGPRQFGLDDIDGRVRHWADALGISRLLERPPFHLSSGEKKRVCLAALLILKPHVLLLDEPTANLDPRSSGWFVDFLQDLDVTTLTATHNLSMAAELGDRTLVLSETHQLIYDGEIDEFLQNRDRLVEANLLHSHRHRHETLEHRHYHAHDWD